MSLVMMTESTALFNNSCWALDICSLYNTKVYIFHFVCSADHIWLKHIALSPSISYCTYMPVCRVWQVHARAFFKKALCAHQNRSIARDSVGPTKSLQLTFRAKSILTSRFSHFPHPLLTRLLSHQYGEVINE